MATSTLVTHCGARVVTRDELDAIEAPAPTQTWFPIKHAVVVDTVAQALTDGGFEIRRNQFALSRDNARIFATLDLVTPLADGYVTLAVGIRNSTDKSLPLGFCAGSRVFVCDNLAMRSELLVNRKHTRFGKDRFQEAICRAVQSLHQFQQVESERIRLFQSRPITAVEAESLMLRSFDQGIISYRLLPRVIQEFRQPRHEQFAANGFTFWRLEQAFTSVLSSLADTNPQRFCSLSIALSGLLSEAAALSTEPQFDTKA